MKIIATSVTLVALGTGTALAGGVDRSGQSVDIIFEDGNYLEFSYGNVNPDVSGIGSAFSPTPGADSGDMAPSYSQLAFGYKHQINDNLSAAIILDQPFGADVAYPVGFPPYFAAGSTAVLDSSALTGVLKYTTANNLSVFAGLRYETMSADASVPFIASYTGSAAEDDATGYLLGVAWEKPEIAARFALTYNSAIDHGFATVESCAAPIAVCAGAPTTTNVTSPESVNLEFQTGIAQDTLLFGSVRWVNWSDFDITPAGYFAITGGGSLVSYDNDTTSYTLGLGRRFNNNWAGAISYGREEASGGFSSNLGPTDGYESVTVGVTYTQGNVEISSGVSYVWIGDTQTTLGGGVAASDFADNTGFGWGLKVGVSF